MDLKKKLRNLIANNELPKAMELLKRTFPDRNDINILKSQYTELQSDKIIGVVSFSEFGLRMNKIRAGLLSIIDSIQFEGEVDPLEEIKRNIESILDKQSALQQGQIVMLAQSVENHNQLFESHTEQMRMMALMEKVIQENLTPDKVEEWQNRPAKTKIKLAIPFIVGKLEREMDITGAEFPKSWAELKAIFLQ
jgi:hypothetical protein